jgi:MFS family permease
VRTHDVSGLPQACGSARSLRRHPALIACCGAHLVQDGLVALQYVLLPILAQAFGLSYAQVGLLRAVSNTASSGLEIPAGLLAERLGERRLLAAGLLTAGLGYLAVAAAGSFPAVLSAFLLAGVGAAFQHSLASSILVRTFDGPSRRRVLGTYNSAGDAGKLAFTAAFGLGIGAGLAWNAVVVALALGALAFAWVCATLLRGAARAAPSTSPAPMTEPARGGRWGIDYPRRFALLGLAVFLDSTVQAVFLTFIAFVMLDRGASEAVASASVVLALSGGMVGKFCCGLVAARVGDRRTFVLAQVMTALGLLAVTVLPVVALLIALPLVGLVVQGSSTVTYGAVAGFVARDRQSRGYALIYTLANGSSVVGPFVFGLIADRAGLDVSLWVLALTAVVTLALSGVLKPADRPVLLHDGTAP